MIWKALLLLCTLFPSRPGLAVWRMLGMRTGRGCHVSMLSVVVADEIVLGPGATIDPLSMVYQPKRTVDQRCPPSP